MVQIRAIQTQRALLTLKPYEIALEQVRSTLPTGRGDPAQYEHDQVLTFPSAGHADILHRHEWVFNVTCRLP